MTSSTYRTSSRTSTIFRSHAAIPIGAVCILMLRSSKSQLSSGRSRKRLPMDYVYWSWQTVPMTRSMIFFGRVITPLPREEWTKGTSHAAAKKQWLSRRKFDSRRTSHAIHVFSNWYGSIREVQKLTNNFTVLTLKSWAAKSKIAQVSAWTVACASTAPASAEKDFRVTSAK